MIVGEGSPDAWLRRSRRRQRRDPGRRSTRFATSWNDGPVHRALRRRHGRRLRRPNAEARRRRGRASCSPTISGSTAWSRASPRQLRRRSLLRSALSAHQQRHPHRPARLRGRACLDRRRRDQRAAARRQEEREARRHLGRLFTASSASSSSSRPAAPACPSGKRRRSPQDFSAARCRRVAAAPASARSQDGDILVVDGRRQSYVIEHAARQSRRAPGLDRSPVRRRSASNMTARRSPMSAAAPPATPPRASR